jgi:hypothetical protein
LFPSSASKTCTVGLLRGSRGCMSKCSQHCRQTSIAGAEPTCPPAQVPLAKPRDWSPRRCLAERGHLTASFRCGALTTAPNAEPQHSSVFDTQMINHA